MIRPFIDQISYGRSIPVVPGWQEVGRTLADDIEKALKGQKSIDDSLADASVPLSPILSRANEDMTRVPLVPWKIVGTLAVAVFAGHAWALPCSSDAIPRAVDPKEQRAKQFYLFALPWIIGFAVFTFGSTVASSNT